MQIARYLSEERYCLRQRQKTDSCKGGCSEFQPDAHFDWLVQERRNSIAYALELSLCCTNPSISFPAICQVEYCARCAKEDGSQCVLCQPNFEIESDGRCISKDVVLYFSWGAVGVECCAIITRSISPKSSQRHPIARPLGRDMGHIFWVKIYIFCLSHWRDVCNIVLYWTAL